MQREASRGGLSWRCIDGGGQDTGRSMSENEPSGGRRSALLALALLVVLGVLGLWVSGALHRTSAVQDCAMQGRSNCTSG